MFDRIKTRLASEEGFTLIELLVVMIILGILVAIAVPAYLSLTSNAHVAAAKSNVRSAIPAAETIYEQTGSYATVTGASLRTNAPGVSSEVKAGPNAAGDGYCIQATDGTSTYFYSGGNGGTAVITQGSCLAAYTVS